MGSSAGYAGYQPTYECNDTTSPGGGRSSPVLDPPVWPVGSELNDEYTNSPPSSPGIYTSQDVVSPNYFDRSFSDALQSSFMTIPSTETIRASPSSYLQPDWNPNWTQGNIQPASSYVPLSLIHDPLTQRNPDENSLTEDPLYSPSSSLTFTGENSPPVTIKKGWGTTKEPTSRRHSHAGGSRSGRHSSRVKEKEHQCPPSKGSSVSCSSKGHRLRSTRTGHKISYSEQEDDPRIETTNNSRTSHNKVEKQYRNRLNGQFSTLLEALPLDLVGAEVEGYSKNDSGGAEKKVSKAEVLLLARRHIENLEREKRGLEGRNGVLVENMQNLKGAWVCMGGQVLP